MIGEFLHGQETNGRDRQKKLHSPRDAQRLNSKYGSSDLRLLTNFCERVSHNRSSYLNIFQTSYNEKKVDSRMGNEPKGPAETASPSPRRSKTGQQVGLFIFGFASPI